LLVVKVNSTRFPNSISGVGGSGGSHGARADFASGLAQRRLRVNLAGTLGLWGGPTVLGRTNNCVI
jgi:hypothetical protein